MGLFKKQSKDTKTNETLLVDGESQAVNEDNESVQEDGNPEEDYVTLLMKVRLKCGHNLVVRDASGSSDPYVKFKYKNRSCFKSTVLHKTLNPVWQEEFSLLIDDPTSPVSVDVYDCGRFATDYMGSAIIDISHLRLFQETELQLNLTREGVEEKLGQLDLTVTVSPLTSGEKDEFLKKSVRGIVSERAKRPAKSTQVWTSIANIVLIEGRNLPFAPGTSSLPDPLVKFRLASEKYKSKPISRTANPKWLEQFDLHLYEQSKHLLELMVIDRRSNSILGKCNIDLDELRSETPNQLLCDLDPNGGSILLLIAKTGTTSIEQVNDFAEYTNNDIRNATIQKYGLLRTFENIGNIGHLIVKGLHHIKEIVNLVFRARDLLVVDTANKIHPFAVLELVNARLQTHSVKASNPEWNKLFTFTIRDIHSVLEITVYDEDVNKKTEFLGKVVIPLLKIRNCEKRWYALKDNKLISRTRGQILLEMDVIWNPIRAAIRTFSPRESKYMHVEPKFKRQLFMNNFNRLTLPQDERLTGQNNNLVYVMRSVWNVFVSITYFIELYHIPLCLLILFLRPPTVQQNIIRNSSQTNVPLEYPGSGSEDEEDLADTGEKNPTTLMQRLNTVQETLAMVQNTLDYLASLLERIKNTFNFTQPYLSLLAIVILIFVTIILYAVPLRWIIIIWGVNKFTKKLRNPNYIPNNELLDFLSRVPSDGESKAYSEMITESVELPNENFQRIKNTF
ncbi:unnamed protein product [Dracunculus medinensis]|uniref:Multiple C2 and transmembrane domain-containing protein 1 n=1 Tax=Dracunculus medinensis TaxID=318479 RepID=A0A158Q3N8_DRAME|nr:unnamed protein product [Dracunculus medinensis]